MMKIFEESLKEESSEQLTKFNKIKEHVAVIRL